MHANMLEKTRTWTYYYVRTYVRMSRVGFWASWAGEKTFCSIIFQLCWLGVSQDEDIHAYMNSAYDMNKLCTKKAACKNLAWATFT